MDYVFRRLALDCLPFETRSALGIHAAGACPATGHRQLCLAEDDFETPLAKVAGGMALRD